MKMAVNGINQFVCKGAAAGGYLDCLKYAHENGCPWCKKTCRNASERGYLNCLKYAYENGCPWDIETLLIAKINNHLDCLNYARENDCPWNLDLQSFYDYYHGSDFLLDTDNDELVNTR